MNLSVLKKILDFKNWNSIWTKESDFQTMKILQTYQKLLAFAIIRDKLMNGRLATAENVQNYPLSLRNVFPMLLLMLCIILSASYILIEAETFKQYSDCFYILVTSIANAGIFMILVWKRAEIFQLIDHLEIMIEKRKNIFQFSLTPFKSTLFNLISNLHEMSAEKSENVGCQSLMNVFSMENCNR